MTYAPKTAVNSKKSQTLRMTAYSLTYFWGRTLECWHKKVMLAAMTSEGVIAGQHRIQRDL
jgi:hypothetical protein